MRLGVGGSEWVCAKAGRDFCIRYDVGLQDSLYP